MTERMQPNGSGPRTARRRTPRSRAARARSAPTIPVPAPPQRDVLPHSEPTLLGFPAEFSEDDDRDEPPLGEADPHAALSSPELVFVRRADPFAAAALVLAGVAANVSLSLSWSPGEGPSGLSLVQRGVEALGSGELASGTWQPVVVVLSGGLLVLLGLLLLVPARAHRAVGLLALVVSLAAAAAVVLLIADTGLADERLGPGMWCAVAVPVLGLLGALKAMLTAPLVRLDVSGAGTGPM
jgi:hypothetical protein